MIPHPQTMQMVTDQHWHELQVRVARERLGTSALLAAGNRELSHSPTGRRVAAAFGVAWSTALASMAFVLPAIPRIAR